MFGAHIHVSEHAVRQLESLHVARPQMHVKHSHARGNHPVAAAQRDVFNKHMVPHDVAEDASAIRAADQGGIAAQNNIGDTNICKIDPADISVIWIRIVTNKHSIRGNLIKGHIAKHNVAIPIE